MNESGRSRVRSSVPYCTIPGTRPIHSAIRNKPSQRLGSIVGPFGWPATITMVSRYFHFAFPSIFCCWSGCSSTPSPRSVVKSVLCCVLSVQYTRVYGTERRTVQCTRTRTSTIHSTVVLQYIIFPLPPNHSAVSHTSMITARGWPGAASL